MNKQEILLLFSFAGILLFIIIAIGIASFFSKGPSSKPTHQVTPSPLPQVTTPVLPPVKYDQKAQERLIQNAKTRQQLSASDVTAKNKLISLLPNDSLTIYQDSQVSIDYIQSADLFQGEIRSKDIQSAKADAVSFFQKQGMSQQGLCVLPLMFYLNANTAEQLRNTGVIFNPLPDGC